MKHEQIRRIEDRRVEQRQKLVLRVGLIDQDSRTSFCLVTNISSAGVQVKAFGKLEQGEQASLRVGDEDPIAGMVVWVRDRSAGVEFHQGLAPDVLLRVTQKLTGQKRRCAPRAPTDLRVLLRTGGRVHRATLCDVSMHGARVRTTEQVNFGSSTIIEVPGLPSMKAYVRWSDGGEHGLLFEAALPIQIMTELISNEGSPMSQASADVGGLRTQLSCLRG